MVVHLRTSTGTLWSDETGAGKEITDPEWISITEVCTVFTCMQTFLIQLRSSRTKSQNVLGAKDSRFSSLWMK